MCYTAILPSVIKSGGETSCPDSASHLILLFSIYENSSIFKYSINDLFPISINIIKLKIYTILCYIFQIYPINERVLIHHARIHQPLEAVAESSVEPIAEFIQVTLQELNIVF